MAQSVHKKSRPSRRRLLRWLFCVILLAGVVTGCRSVGYYQQAIAGQYEILSRQRPIKEVIADPQTRPVLRTRLQLVLDLRAYAASELKLKPDGHYLRYADLGRRYVVWNVYAAPEFSLEPKRWWYPVVGSLKYRGFFSEKDARDYAAVLEKEGYDVYVGGVDAYSTLGYFKDPVLNTFIHNDAPDLAELLFHELAHQRVFAKGDTDFNEAFATTVGQEGARRWLMMHGTPEVRAAYEGEVRRKDEFVALILGVRERLKAVYGEEVAHKPRRVGTPGSAEIVAAKRVAKKAVIDQLRSDYEQLKQRWGGYAGYDRWFKHSLNNAQLNTVAAYYTLVPPLERMLAAHDGNLEAFYREAKSLEKLSQETRRAALHRYEPAALQAAAK